MKTITMILPRSKQGKICGVLGCCLLISVLKFMLSQYMPSEVTVLNDQLKKIRRETNHIDHQPLTPITTYPAWVQVLAARTNKSAEDIYMQSLPSNCTFCLKDQDYRYYELTRQLFDVLQRKPQCLSGKSNVSLSYSNNNSLGILSEIFKGQISRHHDSQECVRHHTFVKKNLGFDHSVEGGNPFRMVSDFARNQLGLTVDSNPNGPKSQSDVIRVCLVARTGYSRNFRNVSELKLALETRDADDSTSPIVRVHVVDFDGLSLRQQIEALTKPSPEFIVMAHGAGESNMLYLDEFTAANTNIIEICPPYMHCVCPNSVRTAFCPWFYYNNTRFHNLSYYALAVEDEQLNCQQYCDGNEHVRDKPGWITRMKVRDHKNLTVSAQSLRSMVYDIMKMEVAPSKEITPDNLDRIRVQQMDFGKDARQKYSDLSKAAIIQVPDIKLKARKQ